jgi:phage tail-like protein
MRREAIERLLPAAFARAVTPESVLGALLDVMETLHAPDETVLDKVDELFDAYRSPDALVAFLAGWVALEHLLVPGGSGESGDACRLPVPVGRMRNVLAEGAALASWRGTPRGLRLLLETITGVPGFVIEEPADRTFHVLVHVPADAAGQLDLIARVVDSAKPAATTCAIVPSPQQTPNHP